MEGFNILVEWIAEACYQVLGEAWEELTDEQQAALIMKYIATAIKEARS